MLEVKNLCAGFGAHQVLKNVSFSLTPHKLTAVVGKNGCGKSTLCAAIGQQLHYTGEILFRGQNITLMHPSERAKAISILPQMLTSPRITVQELVMFGRAPYLDFGKRPQKQDTEAVAKALSAMKLEHMAGRFVSSLSGGERQRAYLAMILAQETRLIVLDEPTTYLDLAYETSFLTTLSELKTRHKKTLMVVMHNLSQAVRHADNLVVLSGGAVAFSGSVEACLEQRVLEDVFGVKKHIFYEGGQQFVVFTA